MELIIQYFSEYFNKVNYLKKTILGARGCMLEVQIWPPDMMLPTIGICDAHTLATIGKSLFPLKKIWLNSSYPSLKQYFS